MKWHGRWWNIILWPRVLDPVQYVLLSLATFPFYPLKSFSYERLRKSTNIKSNLKVSAKNLPIIKLSNWLLKIGTNSEHINYKIHSYKVKKFIVIKSPVSHFSMSFYPFPLKQLSFPLSPFPSFSVNLPPSLFLTHISYLINLFSRKESILG